MAKRRRCLDCPALIPTTAYRGRCDTCRRKSDADRGSRHDRGYDSSHVRQREAVVQAIAKGDPVHCWRCGVALTPEILHLDHASDRRGYRGPACAPCNLELAGRASAGREWGGEAT